MKKNVYWISVICLFWGVWGCSLHRNLVGNEQLVQARQELTKITVFLPLSGNMRHVGVALQQAILAAHYHFNKPMDLVFVDENGQDAALLYAEALLTGTKLIIGPLSKSKIVELLKMEKFEVPIVALNTLDHYQKHYRKNLYQFGLFPEDEIKQLAKQISYFQFQRLGMIVMDEVWSKKLATLFREHYRLPVDVNLLSNKENFSEKICSFLASETQELCNVKERMKKRGTDQEYLMRRQDLNALLVLADNLQARQILPLLQFYYADNLPVFVVSNVYEGVKEKRALLDLEGAYFCDIPWNIHSSLLSAEIKPIYQQIIQTWGNQYGDQNRLYALGVDAYLIAYHFHDFLVKKQFNGGTGKIYLDSYNHFYRELVWIQIKNNRLEIQ